VSIYPNLFTPITVGKVELPNRILMGSMHTGLEDIAGLERLAAYFAARAAEGCALMVTGGFSPNATGRLSDGAASFERRDQVPDHRRVTDAVHGADGRILLQIIHAGRYGYHADIIAPSALAAPINKHMPRAMSEADIDETIDDFVRCALLAQEAGYDGVEIMGSEGYLLTQFIAARTNARDDGWGGNFENRIRLALEIVRRTRAFVDSAFVIMFRLSVLDLVDNGSAPDEIVLLGQQLEAAGCDVLNSGIGWHEAPVPTIAQAVPRAAFTSCTKALKGKVGIPLIASNRINTPDVAEKVLASGDADMVSMARPFLADPAFVAKARDGLAEEINTCIACNQACLDRYFVGRVSSCLVNPAACHETEFDFPPPASPSRVAVVGAGVAGLACAVTASGQGHDVTLFEATDRIGGQFNLARRVPGKYEFDETLRYFMVQLENTGVDVRLGQSATADDLRASAFDAVVLASGIAPRPAEIDGIDSAEVIGYTEALEDNAEIGRRVAIIGGGGIAFDVALYLLEGDDDSFTDPDAFRRSWGIGVVCEEVRPRHEITMLQRSPGPMGRGLGKSTGWIHRAVLKRNQVRQLSGVTYERIDADGVHIEMDGASMSVAADTVIVCAGQESRNELMAALDGIEVPVHTIGGARKAGELDAERAIREGVELGLKL
jgi:2,4-dienoyl-CoA reductase (NADPH2)